MFVGLVDGLKPGRPVVVQSSDDLAALGASVDAARSHRRGDRGGLARPLVLEPAARSFVVIVDGVERRVELPASAVSLDDLASLLNADPSAAFVASVIAQGRPGISTSPGASRGGPGGSPCVPILRSASRSRRERSASRSAPLCRGRSTPSFVPAAAEPGSSRSARRSPISHRARQGCARSCVCSRRARHPRFRRDSTRRLRRACGCRRSPGAATFPIAGAVPLRRSGSRRPFFYACPIWSS